jgi:Zn-dependent peptidase ImmA (M78 family)
MSPAKRAEINLLATTIRDGLELESPIDVQEAVKRLGGILTMENSLENNMEAKVRKSGDSFQIVLQKTKPAARKRFSIAHEIGHLFLHMGYLIDPEKWNRTQEYRDSIYYRFGHGLEEREANEFAAAFLMPEDEFKDIAQQTENTGAGLLNAIALHFQTSKDAVLNRGRMLGIFE